MGPSFVVVTALLIVGETPNKVVVASKSFTESVIIAETVTLLGEGAGFEMQHKARLGGTGIAWQGLVDGDIDLYPDYTGTIARAILEDESLRDAAQMRERLAKYGVVMSKPLGFYNNYAMGMMKARAEELRITKISDLRDHPDLIYAFSNEFKTRGDGWKSLRSRYSLSNEHIRGVEHALAYPAIENGSVDVMDVYTTDAQIEKLDLALLVDDLQHFPKYDAVLLYREDLRERAPKFVAAIQRLSGALPLDKMRQLNEQVDIDKKSERRVAHEFATEAFDIRSEFVAETLWTRLWRTTLQHFFLVGTSLISGIVVAVPLGVIAAKRKSVQQIILGTTEIIQTIPSLALLVLLIAPVSWVGLPALGPIPAIIALFLYSLLPIVRNTYTGIQDIPSSIKESAMALGLTPWATLWKIELPLASRLILAGVKTTAVINVGYATLGGLIGAGGYGQPVMAGIGNNDTATMLEGAIPAAVLALLVKFAFELSERFVVPRGLQINSRS